MQKFKPYNVYVYGTLRKGNGNHVILNESQPICDGTLRGYKMFTLGGFPAIVHTGNDSDVVVGEVYRVDTPYVQDRLDSLEGYDRTGDRPNTFYDIDDVEVCPIGDEDHHSIPCEVYTMTRNFSDDQLIPHGDWMKRHAS